MVLSFLCRNQKSPDDLVIEFDAPLIKPRDDLDPTRKRRPGAAPRPRVDPKDTIMKYVPKRAHEDRQRRSIHHLQPAGN